MNPTRHHGDHDNRLFKLTVYPLVGGLIGGWMFLCLAPLFT